MAAKLTRRQFQFRCGALGGSLMIGTGVTAPYGGAQGASAEPDTGRPACDFQSSFMTWDFPPRPDPRPDARHNCPLGNQARIQLDELLDVIDDTIGQSERFVLIAPCRAEWVYAEDRLFQIPSREYRNIYSRTHERSMGRQITCGDERSQGRPWADTFRSLAIDVRTFAHCTLHATPVAINEATATNRPLVGRTTIHDPKRGVRYVLEYPIKTMNFRPENASFQVDTGPVLVPDFESSEAQTIDRLEMAHIACNRLDRAEFILRRPTPIRDEQGKELCRVLHYAEVREYAAVTQILSGTGRES